MPLKLVMMGTGEFALPAFLALYETDHQVVGLFTQPDRTGRGHHRHRNPLKETAIEHSTPVFQPKNVNTPESLEQLRALQADVFVVAAYGQILSAELLSIPAQGAINLHASLLPKYRGAAPIQYAIWKGETETGVTIFRIEPKLDAGPILGVVKTDIGLKETSGELSPRLATLAVPTLVDVLDRIATGHADPIIQDPTAVTRAPRLKKDNGLIDWSKTAEEIGWHLRAMQPWPKPSTSLVQEGHPPLRLLILDIEPCDEQFSAEPGQAVFADSRRLVVQTGSVSVEVLRLQPDGKRALTTAEFLCGHTIRIGDRLV
jgi:methionyl-tRNA formyltransferase